MEAILSNNTRKLLQFEVSKNVDLQFKKWTYCVIYRNFLAHIRSLLQRLDGPVATAVAKSSLAEFRSVQLVQLVRYEWVVYRDCIINDTTDQS